MAVTDWLWVAAFVVACLAVVAVNVIKQRVQLRQRLAAAWHQRPTRQVHDSQASLAEADRVYAAAHPGTSRVDDLTWRDLNMQAVFDLLNQTESSVGSEALYTRLHSIDFTKPQVAEDLVAFFEDHAPARLAVRTAFAHLGKTDHNQAQDYLQNAEHYRLPNSWHYTVMGWLPVAALALIFVVPVAGIGLLLASLLTNVVVYTRRKSRLEVELGAMRYLIQTIAVAKHLCRIQTPRQAALQHAYAPLAAISRHAFVFRTKTGSTGDVAGDYLGIMIMLPFRQYNRVLTTLSQQREAALALWTLLGDLEVAIAVANFRGFMPVTCQPQFAQGGVQATNLVHPLLPKPVANAVAWSQTALITGANAAGKSTYVKSVAINCILAQTINTATAKTFRMAHGHVVSAMAVQDDLAAGDSYFIAEIKAIRRVLQLAQGSQRVYGFIDEILKGTNTVERIAASASVVQWLVHTQTLAMVATHDIELTGILGAQAVNWHFQETVDHAGVHFDYRLHQGPATTHNAIALLATLQYPEAITASAEQLAHTFETTHAWPQAKV